MQQPYRATHCQRQSLISHNILLLSIKAHIYNYNQNIRPISVYCSVNLLIVNVESLYIYIIGEITSGGAKQYLIYLRDNWYWLCNVKAVSIFLVETMQSQEFFFIKSISRRNVHQSIARNSKGMQTLKNRPLDRQIILSSNRIQCL